MCEVVIKRKYINFKKAGQRAVLLQDRLAALYKKREVMPGRWPAQIV